MPLLTRLVRRDFLALFSRIHLEAHARFSKGIPEDGFHQVTGSVAVPFARIVKRFDKARIDSY